MRSCARERVVSILFIVFWIGRGRNQFALHRRTRGQRLMMSYFRYANRLVLSSYKTNTQPAQLGKKKITLFLFSPKYISPKDPLPIFRPTRYLFPMRSSMPLEVILLLYFFVCAFTGKAREESNGESGRTKRIKSVELFAFPRI